MKVCVLGTAPGSRLLAPYDDKSWEIWVCSAGNSQAQAVPRVTKWFELHAICDMVGPENKAWSIPYYNWLRAQSFPIYMQEKNDYIPQAIVFPYKALTERFGPNPKKGMMNWFTSSITWMMAFAMVQMKPGDELGIFGVDMAAMEEAYTAQKAGIHRMMEYADSLGIKVTIPYESCLAKALPLYGYAEATPMGRKWMVRLHEMQAHRNHIDGQCKQFELQRAFFDGALEGVKYDIRTWVDGSEADLETDGKETAIPMLNTLKEKAEQLSKATVTGDFSENAKGLFVPAGLAATPVPSAESVLPEGSTVSVDSTGNKHYGMLADPVRMSARPPGEAVKRNKNGKDMRTE